MKNTITNKDVETFLTDLNIKISVFGIIFRDDRGKNMQTLLDLEITPKTREDIIKTLTPDDYIDGPIPDTLHHYGEMWIFGKDVKRHEVYIKVALNMANMPSVCISFPIAEHKLRYYFK